MAVERFAEPAPERLPPHNTAAEEAVLGSILIDPECLNRLATFLHPEDFYRERNGLIYAAMLSLFERREPVDYLTLADELQRQNRYEEAGGLPYLSSLLSVVPTSAFAEHYGRIVERTAVMRRLIQAAADIAKLGFQDSRDVDETLERAEQLLMGVAQRRATRDFASLAEVLREYLDQLRAIQDREQIAYGIPGGFIDLDKITGGFQRSDLIILAARPSLGKTSLALNFAVNAATRFHARVAIFSLEMSAWQLAARLLSMEAGVDSARLRLGRLNADESRRLGMAIGTLSEAPIYIDDTPGISLSELRTKARRLHADPQRGLDMIIIDYLQLVVAGSRDNRVQEISEISRALKGLARELRVPVIALSQLSRAVESRSPHIHMLSDLRESGSIEQDADVVLFIYREDVYNKDTDKKGIAEIHIAKHRNGPTGQISLLFQEKTTKFLDLEVFRE